MAALRPVKTPPRGLMAEAVPVSATRVPPVSWRIIRDVRVPPSLYWGPRSVTEEATVTPGHVFRISGFGA
jgi:hypothetical protein